MSASADRIRAARPSRWFRGLSLRARLFLLVTASLAPLLAFSLAVQYLDYRAARAAAGERALQLARSTMLVIEGELRTRIAALQVLARTRAMATGDLAALRVQAEAMVAQQFPGSNVLLLKEDGQQVMNTLLPAEAPLPVRRNLRSIRQVLETGLPAVSDLFPGAAVERSVVAIDVPVTRADGSIAYVLSINPRLDRFGEVVREQRFPASWLITVFDRRGIILARALNAERFIGHEASASLLPHLVAEPDGVLDTTSLEGEPLLTVFSHGQQFGWAVAIGVPWAELTTPALKTATATLAVGGGLLLASLVLALLVARRIASPIAALRRLAAATGTDAPIDPPATGLREADEVADALAAAEASRRASEARVRRSEAQLRLFIEAAPAAIAMFDREMRYLAASRRFVEDYRLPSADLIGRSHYDLFPELPERWREVNRRCLAGATERSEGEAFPRADGKIDWVRWEIRPWYESDARIGGLVLFSEVVTQQREAETRVQELQSELLHVSRLSAMGQMGAALAHEINQPLAAILNYLQAARRFLAAGEGAPLDKIGEIIGKAAEQATRAGDIIRHLRSFVSKGESRRSAEALADVVEEATKLAMTGARHHGVHLRFDFDAEVSAAPINRVQIQQVLVNLVRNAMEAMSRSERRELSVSIHGREDGMAEIAIADTGPGLPPEVAAQLFQPFVTTKSDGMGVGLSICRSIVEGHRGRIWTSENPGGGTIFHFTLPQAEAQAETEARV
jgi:two-component system sensor kinase FixL